MPSKKPFVETRILDDMLEMASAMQDHALISKPDQYFPIEV